MNHHHSTENPALTLKSSFLVQAPNVCVSGVLESGGADFEDGEEVFDAIGGVLQEVSADSKNEDDVRDICLQMFNTLKL